VTVEPTQDEALLAQILLHPQVFHFRSLCDGISEECFKPPEGLYLVAKEGGAPLGVFYFHPQNPRMWQAHVAFLPTAWGGRQTREAARLAIQWLKKQTTCRKLLLLIPNFNQSAIQYIERLGGKHEATIRQGCVKQGVLAPELIYTLEVS